MSDRVEVVGSRECDIHKHLLGTPGVRAEYDGRTKSGPWAHMCGECFAKHGVGLGTGVGQKLVYVG